MILINYNYLQQKKASIMFDVTSARLAHVAPGVSRHHTQVRSARHDHESHLAGRRALLHEPDHEIRQVREASGRACPRLSRPIRQSQQQSQSFRHTRLEELNLIKLKKKLD